MVPRMITEQMKVRWLRQVIGPTRNVPKEGLAERVKEQGLTTDKNFQETLAIKTGRQPKMAPIR
jgi:hypothetical protein